MTRFKTRLHSRKSDLVGMHLILLLPLFPFATYTNTATIRCEIFHFARRQNFRKDTINCRWCFGWGLSQHSGVPLPCLKWTLTIGCINTAQRPSLSPGPFIYSWAPIWLQEVGGVFWGYNTDQSTHPTRKSSCRCGRTCSLAET